MHKNITGDYNPIFDRTQIAPTVLLLLGFRGIGTPTRLYSPLVRLLASLIRHESQDGKLKLIPLLV